MSTVRGRLRADVGVRELVRATFPPASVTGAPKPRVLQAIEDLEPVRRGVYCGAVGWLDTERGEGDLAVAIRTFTIADGRTHLGVGAASWPTPIRAPSGARPSSKRSDCSRPRMRARAPNARSVPGRV